MSDENTTDNVHATGEPAAEPQGTVHATGEPVAAKNVHATIEPERLDDSGEASTDNVHATDEPA